MPAFTIHEMTTERGTRKRQWARISFFLILAAWNVYLLVGAVYTLWMRHHPHIQPATNTLVLSVLLDLFVVGSVVIVAAGAIVRQLARRRQRSDVRP
jgi:hypothetical protein